MHGSYKDSLRLKWLVFQHLFLKMRLSPDGPYQNKKGFGDKSGDNVISFVGTYVS